MGNQWLKNAYGTLKLDELSKAVLGDGTDTGKYKGLTGKDFQSLAVNEQRSYILKDAQLVMKLSKHNNGEVLDAMKAISELTDLDFEKVCRTGLSTWWAAIFNDTVSREEQQTYCLPTDKKRNELIYALLEEGLFNQ